MIQHVRHHERAGVIQWSMAMLSTLFMIGGTALLCASYRSSMRSFAVSDEQFDALWTFMRFSKQMDILRMVRRSADGIKKIVDQGMTIAPTRGCLTLLTLASGRYLILGAADGDLCLGFARPPQHGEKPFVHEVELGPLSVDRRVYYVRFPRGFFRGFGNKSLALTETAISLWFLVPLFAIYPVIFFAWRPLRRRKRRKRGWCIRCGYDLTGNVSGICAECGRETA